MATSILSLACPKCGAIFASVLQMDQPTFERILFDKQMLERCSACGGASRFEKTDYLFVMPTP